MESVRSIQERGAALVTAAGPYARAILVQTPQGQFAVPIEDQMVGEQLRFRGGWGLEELKRMSAICHRQTRLLVVGAHVGSMAIPLSKLCHSVVAVEANPQLFELLKLNLIMNGVSNCRLIQKAASNRVETLEFVMNRVNSGGSKRVPKFNKQFYFEHNPTIIKVDAAPLDDLLPGEVFDVILMDIEGSEYFALQGMQRLLSRATVLQVEFIPHHLKNVSNISVADFVATVAPHFYCLCLSHSDTPYGGEAFVSILQEMFASDMEDEGLLFLKALPQNVRFH